MGANIEKDLRSKLFRHLESMPHKYFDNVKVGTLMSRITTDLFDITEFAHHCPEEFFIAGVKIIGLLVILLVFHIQYWLLTLCLFAMLPVMVVFAVKYNGKMRRVHKSNRRQMAEINAQCEDTLSGIRVVKSFTNEALEEQKFAVNNERFLEIKKKNYHYMAVFSCGMNFFGAVIYMTIIILGGYLELDAAAFVEYLLYANTLLATIRMIAEYAEQFQRGVTAFERFEEVVGEPADLYDLPGAKDIVSVEGKVEFDGVFFRYSDETDWVLKNLSFYVDKGETLAIVGPSGSGKTTIANLIPRFYDVQKGSVKIDGKDIRELTLHSLRGSIGVVQQDVFLFGGLSPITSPTENRAPLGRKWNRLQNSPALTNSSKPCPMGMKATSGKGESSFPEVRNKGSRSRGSSLKTRLFSFSTKPQAISTTKAKWLCSVLSTPFPAEGPPS